MAKIKTQCPVCEFTVKAEVPPTICPQCGADLTRPGVEVVLRKAHGSFAPGKIGGTAGWWYLTNFRLFFVKDASTGMGAALGGVVGAVVEAAVTSGDTGRTIVNLPLADIGSLDETKAGLMKALVLTSRTHGPRGKVVVPKRDEWRDAVGQAVAQYGGR